MCTAKRKTISKNNKQFRIRGNQIIKTTFGKAVPANHRILLEMSKLVAACFVFRVMCLGYTRFHKAHLTLSQSTQSPVTITMCAPIRRYVFRGLSCATTGDQPARAGPRDNRLPQQAQRRPPTAPYFNNLHMSSHTRNTFAKAIELF